MYLPAGNGLVSFDPATKKFAARLTLSGMTASAAHIHPGALGVNGPIIEGKLAGKLSASFLNSDGWSTRYDSQNGNNEHRIVLRTALRYVPADSLDMQLNADYSEQNNVGPQGYLIRYLTSPAPFPPAKAARFNTYAAAAENLRLGLPAGSLYDNRWASADPYKSNALQGGYDNYQIGGASVVASCDW